jgi:hypothetical protein
MERVKVTIYTDPGCPFGFNAQRQEAQLLWHYGDGLDIARRMIVLTEKSSSFEERGLSREMVADSGVPPVRRRPDPRAGARGPAATRSPSPCVL